MAGRGAFGSYHYSNDRYQDMSLANGMGGVSAILWIMATGLLGVFFLPDDPNSIGPPAWALTVWIAGAVITYAVVYWITWRDLPTSLKERGLWESR